MNVGERIKARLAEIGMSNAALARAVGESPQRVGNYLNGHRKPAPEMLRKIAAAISLDPAVLNEDEQLSLEQVELVVQAVCAAAGLSNDQAIRLGAATVEALRLIQLLPPAEDDSSRTLMAAHAAWHAKRR